MKIQSENVNFKAFVQPIIFNDLLDIQTLETNFEKKS